MGNLRMCGCEWLDGGKTFRECADHAELRQRAEQAERERDEARLKVERLTAALRGIGSHPERLWLPNELVELARAALEDK